MKFNLKIMLIIAFFCIPSIAIFASSPAVSSSSSSTAPTVDASSLPLAKIFPLELTPQEIDGSYEQISPDMRYVFFSTNSGPMVYDRQERREITLELEGSGHIDESFTTIISAVWLHQGFNPDGLFHFYDFQEKVANPNATPFFSQQGEGFIISPNGHYALITSRNNENQLIYSVYDLQQRNPEDQHNPLFTIPASSTEAVFSADSQKIKIEKPMSIEIIDIALKANAPQDIPSSVEFPKEIYGSSPKLDKKFKYIIRRTQNNDRFTIFLYNIQTKMNNSNAAPLAIFPPKFQGSLTETFGPQSKMLALSNLKLKKTDFYNLESLNSDIAPTPSFSMPDTRPMISPHHAFALTFNQKNRTINNYNISTRKLTTGIPLDVEFFSSFSSNGKYVLTQDPSSSVYDLENNMPIITSTGFPILLNNEKGTLLNDGGYGRAYIYDVNFLNDPAFQAAVQGRLSLAQHALMALLNKHYGNPISLSAIAKDEGVAAVPTNIALRAVLSSFPNVIKQAIIKKYNIIDAPSNIGGLLSNKEEREIESQIRDEGNSLSSVPTLFGGNNQ